MLARSRTAAVLVLASAWAAAGSGAIAAPTTVQLRVEGESSTIYEGPVTTDGRAIQKDPSGPHPCDGTNAGKNPSPGPTITSALEDASVTNDFSWGGTWNQSFQDFFIDRIGPDANKADFSKSWSYSLNGKAVEVGGCQQRVQAGDRVLFAYGAFGSPLLELSGPSRVAAGQPFTLLVRQYDEKGAATPASGARVAGRATGADGRVGLRFASAGTRRLKAGRAGSVRSNALDICVYVRGSGECGTADTVRPVLRLTSPRPNARYSPGPRLLAGSVRESGGIRSISLRLLRTQGRDCTWYSGELERFVSNCRRARPFGVGDRAEFSYLLPGRLGRGSYLLDARAVDRAGNVGTTRVRFSVR